VRQEPLYRRYAAVERQADNLAAVQTQTERRASPSPCRAEIAATVEQLRGASTQAEVDKHNAKLAVLAGQLAHLDAQRRDEADKLQTQQILNENQAAKERQDFLEKPARRGAPDLGHRRDLAAEREGNPDRATPGHEAHARPHLRIAFAGLTVCGLLVLRHACGTAPLLPVSRRTCLRRLAGMSRPMDRWQGEIKVDTRTDYPSDPMRRLHGKAPARRNPPTAAGGAQLMENFAPGLRESVLSLTDALRVVVFFVCVVGLVLQIQQARADTEGLTRPLVRAAIVVGLVATLPHWFGFTERVFPQRGGHRAGRLHASTRCGRRCKLRETVSGSNSDFSLRRIGESLYRAFLYGRPSWSS
jgi:hypothetical protein